MSENWLTLSLLNLHILEPLAESMLKTVRINFRTLSRICVKADPWVIPTCRVCTARYRAIRLHCYIYSMPDGVRVPTLQEHFIDAQDQTPLPIWRPEVYFKYPDDGDLDEEEIFRLLELFRSCLLGKRAVLGVVKRTKENIHDFQKDTYQLGILTLNLGHINCIPYI